MNGIRPCPFCGNAKCYMRAGVEGQQIICEDCGARGPLVHEGGSAAWDRRAEPKERQR